LEHDTLKFLTSELLYGEYACGTAMVPTTTLLLYTLNVFVPVVTISVITFK